jgi:hypothetical protein
VSEGGKPITDVTKLFGIFAWLSVTTFVKILAISWYAYYSLQTFTPSEFHVYLRLAMWVLSIFGLWQAIEMLERWISRTAARMEKRYRPSKD